MRFVVIEMSPKHTPTNKKPNDNKNTKANVNKKNTVGSGVKTPTKTPSNKKKVFNVATVNKSVKMEKKRTRKQ